MVALSPRNSRDVALRGEPSTTMSIAINHTLEQKVLVCDHTVVKGVRVQQRMISRPRTVMGRARPARLRD
jgi:hypothetical protein